MSDDKQWREFEAWAKSEGWIVSKIGVQYDCDGSQVAWEAWQAAQAAQAEKYRAVVEALHGVVGTVDGPRGL